MNSKDHGIARRPIVAAVRGVLLGFALAPAGAALAQDAGGEPSAAQLTTPAQSVTLGAGAVSRDAIKANEYDGLQRHGGYSILDFDLRGGGLYNEDDASRWRLSATDLGLETREIRGEYGEQGTFRITAGFDSLIRSGSAVYESISSPLQGIGTTSLTMPGNWAAPLYRSSATMAAGNAYPSPSASMLGLAATGYSSPLVAGTQYICRSTTNGCVPNAALGGAYTTGLPVTAANTNMLAQNATDLSDFQSVRLSTRRDKQEYGATYELSAHWSAHVDMSREDKRGLKPLGVVNSSNGGLAGENSVTIPEVINTTTDQYNARLDYKGDRVFLSAAYFGSMFDNHVKSMTVADPYAVATFNNATQSAYGISSATISEEPNSTFNQLRLNGGYEFTAGTRLVADASYGRDGQNEGYILDPSMFGTPTGAANAAANNGSYVPVNSANAAVVTKSFDLKLTGRPAQGLNLDAAYKYDLRDNQTPVHTYTWYDAGAKNFGAAGGNLNGASIPELPAGLPIYSGVNIVANRPYSKRMNELDAGADWAFARGQAVRAGVQWQSIDRWCNDTWIDCSFADTSRETTGKLEYRYSGAGSIHGRVAADVGHRSVDYNPDAWMSLAPALAATNLTALAGHGYSGSVLGFLQANGLTPYGLSIAAHQPSGLSGNTLAIYNLLYGTGNGGLSNAYYGVNNVTQNWPGLDVYNMANRNRDRLRASVDWQATDAFDLQAGMDYRHDNYPDNTYGLQKTDSWALNLDGDWRANDDLSFGAYFNHEDQRSDSAGNSASNGAVTLSTAAGVAYTTATGATGTNSGVAGGCIGSSSTAGYTGTPTAYQVYNDNLKISPCTLWQSQIHDRADTLGLSARKDHLVIAPLSLSGDLSFSRSVTGNSMGGGNYAANPYAAYVAGAPAIEYINATSLPDVVVNSLRVKLVGDYRIGKTGSVRVGYTFIHLQVNDYTYASTQPAYTSSSVMPVMAQAPNENVSIVGVSYTLRLQ